MQLRAELKLRTSIEPENFVRYAFLKQVEEENLTSISGRGGFPDLKTFSHMKAIAETRAPVMMRLMLSDGRQTHGLFRVVRLVHLKDNDYAFHLVRS